MIEGLSGIDIALWDIKASISAFPCISCSAVRSGLTSSPTQLAPRRKVEDPIWYPAEEAAGYVVEGFSAVKLKVCFGVEDDALATRVVRQGDLSDCVDDGGREPRL